MNSKAPVPGSRDSLEATDARVDARTRREDTASSSLLTGPRARRTGDEAHAALTGDVHDMLGNSVVRAALTGMETGPAAVVGDALTLGAAGMQVADSASGLFSNQFMQGQLAAGGPAPTVAASASALSRHGSGEEFSEEAGKKVDVALKRGGQPLSDGLRARMEAAFGGADFSRVRIHTDGAALAAAEGIRAHAFAVGEHVYFGSGEFRPHSRAGQELLAHELTHVVQHQEGRIRASDSSGGQAGDVSVSSPTDSHEREAEATATRVVGSLGSVDTTAPDTTEATADSAESAVATGPATDGTASSAAPADGAMASRFGFSDLKKTVSSAVSGAEGVGGAMQQLGLPGADQLGQVTDMASSALGLTDQLQGFNGDLASLEGALQKVADLGRSVGQAEVDRIAGMLDKLASGLGAVEQAKGMLEQVQEGGLGGLAGGLTEGLGGGLSEGLGGMLGGAGGAGGDLASGVDMGGLGGLFEQAQSTFGNITGLVDQFKQLTEGDLDLEQLKSLASAPQQLKALLGQLEKWKSLLGQQGEMLEQVSGAMGGLMGGGDSPLGEVTSTLSLKQAPGKHTPRDTRAAIPGTTGHGLPAQTAAALRSQLGPAVDKVRVHTGPEAEQFAQALGARAVTVGQDIYFNKGEFRPGTTVGDQLLGHEMHHAVIGGGGPGVSQPGDSHEREADAFGDEFVEVGGTQALTRIGLEVPPRALAGQLDDRLAGIPRDSLSVADVDAELAAEVSAPDLSTPTVATPSFDVPANEVDLAPATDLASSVDTGSELSVEPVATPMGNAESLSRDLLASASQAYHGTAQGASSTTSGTSETSAETHAELTIAGKVYRVKVPPSEGQTATANCDIDARPCAGIHLTGATVNIDAEGVISGGTVRGKLDVEGLFDGTDIALGILPGGAIAPSIENLPVKLGPATGTVSLSITEAGLEGSGSVKAAELGLPEWVGIRSGELEIALSGGKVTGGASLTGTTTATGTAQLESQLAESVLTSTVTYTVVPNYTPVPGVVVNNAVLSGTLTTPLKGGKGGEEGGDGGGAAATEGPNTDSAAAAPSVAPTSGNAADTSGGSGAPAAQTAMQGNLDTAFGGGGDTGPSTDAQAGDQQQASGDQAQGSDQSTDGGSGAGGDGGASGPAARDPNAFLLRGNGNVTMKEWVTGDVDVALDPAAGTYDMSGTLSAAKEMQFGELLAVKSEVSLTVQQNVATEAAAIVDFKGPKYSGKITGAYDIQGHLLDGTAQVGLTEDWPIEGEWGFITLKKGGSLDATVDDNKLKDVNGRVSCDGEIKSGETALTFSGELQGTFDAEKEQVDGTVSATTTADFQLPTVEGSTDRLTLLKDSIVRGEVKENKLDTVKLTAGVQYDREGEPFLNGSLQDATYTVADGTVSGQGTFTLLKDLERKTTDGKWTIRVLAKTNVEATVEKSALKELGGDITVQVDDENGKLAQGQLTGAKIDIATWETSGKLKLTTARKFFHPGEGQTMANGYSLAVMIGSGISATVKKDELTEVGGDLRCMISDEVGALARVRLQATLDLQKDEVDGKGTLSLARQLIVAENLAGAGWTAKVKRGSKGIAHIEKGDFTKITGELKGQIDDEQGKFLSVDGSGEWTTADNKFSIVGKVTVEKEKQLAEGGEAGWSLTLMPEATNATATIEKDVFKGINGTIVTMVRKAGADFSKVQLTGSWTEADGFTGKGAAELLTEIDVATVGDYNVLVDKGTGAEIEVKKNDIEQIGGKVPMRLDEKGAQFIKGKVEGSYKIKDKVLSGSGQAEVLVEKHLGTMGTDQLWLVKSSNASVTLEENKLTKVGGEMNLSVRNGEGEYAQIALQGSFDAAGGTGFTGTGSTEVTRDNKLFEVQGYSFWLKKGTGATAHIDKDELKKIDGSVPFMVKDGGAESLIEGSVTGVYDPASGEITGKGAVYLGRDLKYDLGGGTELRLLKGSGGDADVNKSKLERLGGTLTAEIWKNGEGIVQVTASGEYNVVTNTLTSLTGTATLLKPLELLGGNVIVSNVSGTATIENNELVEAGGKGDLLIKPLNDMKGWFEVKWSNRGGNETYEGTGNVEFTLIKPDADTGRGMSGEVGVTAKSDGTFTAVGDIDYQINEIIGGKLQVSVDQNWDPKVYGNINVDTNLVEARDLFKMEKDLLPEQTVRLPYGLALFYGMKGGMGMAMDALRLQAGITVGDWHPLTEGDVPKFQSNLDLTWGMNFNAKVVPYLGLGGDIGFASAQMGVKGEVELNAPVKAKAGGEIKGEGGGFYGELSVGISIAPEVDLALIPYIKGEIPNLFSFEEDLDRFEQPLGKIFEFEWGGKYGFGDTQYKNQAPITPADVPAPSHKETKREGKPASVGIGNGGGGGGQAKKGAPQLESGNEVAQNQKTGDGKMEEVMNTLNDVIAVVEGIGAAGELFGMLVSALAALATFGPAGLVVHIVWNIFTGELSWDKIKTAVVKVVKAVQAAGRLLRKHFPGWWNSIVDVFNGEKPGLLDALFGADDRMREAVGRGDHRYAPYDMHKEMVNTMKGGWLSDDDANCIAQVFEVAAQRGWLGRLVSDCGGADEFIDGWSTGFDDSRIKRVFRRNGIRFDD